MELHVPNEENPQKKDGEKNAAYRERIVNLKRDRRFRYMMVFKNHGSAAGASLEHSHSQIVALPIVPKRVYENSERTRDYFRQKDRRLFCPRLPALLVLLLLLQLSFLFKTQLRRLLAFLDPLAFLFHNILLFHFCFSLRSIPERVRKSVNFQ